MLPSLPTWFHSLQFRLTAGFAAALALTLVGASVYASQATRHEIERFAEEVNEARAARVEQLVSDAYRAGSDWGEVQGALEQAGALLGWWLTVTDPGGTVVADSHREITPESTPVALEYGRHNQLPLVIGDKFVGSLFLAPDRPGWGFLPLSGAFVEARQAQVPPDGGESAGPTEGPGPGREAALTGQVAIEPSLDRLAASFRNSLLFAGLAAGAAGILAVSLGMGRALAPVHTLTAVAGRLGRGDLSQRVPARGRDEVGELGNSFNEMARALERAEQQRRTMTADIAHELRTPLSNVRGYLEAIRNGIVAPDAPIIDTLYEQTLHLSRLVEDLRLAAIVEAGALRLERGPVLVQEIAEDTVDAFRTRAAERRLTLTLDARPDLPEVSADRTRLHQIVANLLENALMHTPEGGRVTVSAGRAEDGWVRLEVADSGPGIPPDEIPFIFDQFYRVDPSRTRETGGAGLGLTIVKRLVEAHGGRVSAESEVGLGTRISVELPVSADEVQ